MIFIKKLILSIDSSLIKFLIFLFLLLLFGMFLETLSIGLVIPAIGSFLDPNNINPKFILFIKYFYNNINIDNLLIVSVTLLFIVFFIKIFFLVLISWFQNYIIFKIRYFYNIRLYNIYLKQNLLFHISKKSSEIIRNLINEVESFTSTYQVVFILINEILAYLKKTK